MNVIAADQKTLNADFWQAQAKAHEERILPWVTAFRERRKRRLKHPVHDFLFEYYQCKRRLLAEWHPELGMILEGKEADLFLKNKRYSKNEHGVYLDPQKLDPNEQSRIQWITRLLGAATQRRSQFQCFGLHEWAMVYKSDRIRHYDTPLRLSQKEIQNVVKTHPICCTHYDAFRFFTDAARPLNTIQPKEKDRRKNEQFGCVHFNMDLFKWCYKLHPWISCGLMADGFFLAVAARELDMRASPYDLVDFGYEPICIETPEGRETYQTGQRNISEKGRELAIRFLDECRCLSLAQKKETWQVKAE